MNRDFHPDVHQQIRLHRVEKRLSLRKLAVLSGFSSGYISRIEKGSVTASNDAIQALAKILSFKPWSKKEDNRQMVSMCKDMVIKDIYGDYDEANRLAIIIEDAFAHAPHRESISGFGTYAVSMTFHALFEAIHNPTTPKFTHCIDRLYPRMFALGPAFKGFDHELHLIAAALYHFRAHDDACGQYFLSRHLQFSADTHLIGLNRFLQGIAYHMDYRTQSHAYTAFSKAQEIFQTTNNFQRMMHIKIYMQTIALNTGNLDMFMKLHDELDGYASATGKILIYRQNKTHLARYHIIRKEYAEARDILRELKDSPYPEFHFYNIIVHYRCGDLQAAKQAVRMLESSHHFLKESHRLFARAMATFLDDDIDRETSLEHLQAFVDEAIEEGDIKTISLGIGLFMQTLERQRKYKQAARYSETILKMIETAAKVGEHSEELPQGTMV